MTRAPSCGVRFIEEEERRARWYGGAIGQLTFDGSMNAGLRRLRFRMKDGVAEIRAGATLLFDSDPNRRPRRLKAAALFTAIRGPARRNGRSRRRPSRGRKVLLIDRGFVSSTLAGYIHSRGRNHDVAPRFARTRRGRTSSDLVVLSRGQAARRFRASRNPRRCSSGIPSLASASVCRGIVEYFGGSPRARRAMRQTVARRALPTPAATRIAEAHDRPLSFALCGAQPVAAGPVGRRRNRDRVMASSMRRCRSPRCSSIPDR